MAEKKAEKKPAKPEGTGKQEEKKPAKPEPAEKQEESGVKDLESKEKTDSGQEQEEESYLKDLMAHTGGDIATAIDLSGLSRARFYALLKKHGIATSIRPK